MPNSGSLAVLGIQIPNFLPLAPKPSCCVTPALEVEFDYLGNTEQSQNVTKRVALNIILDRVLEWAVI